MISPVPVAVFASGSGTNAQALFERERQGAAWRTRLLVSDREDAGALERARRAGIPARVVPVKGRPAREVEEATLTALEEAGVRLIFLAGYLRLVPGAVVRAFGRRILNIHPALLPAFGGRGMYGRHVHEAVLAAGARVTGVTVHLVDERFDEGTILAQWPVPVRDDDSVETLARRVLRVEHCLYPLVAQHAARAVAEDRPVSPVSPVGPVPAEGSVPPMGPVPTEDPAFSLVDDLAVSSLERTVRSAFAHGTPENSSPTASPETP